MPAPTRDDLALNDTPVLDILDRGAAPGTDRARIAAAQHVLRVAKRLLSRFALEFDSRGLSPGRYAVLTTLASAGPLAPSEIAGRIGVTRPTMTGLIRGLVKAGLVEPADPGDDQRRKAFRLSRRGRETLASILPDILHRMEAMLAPLDDAETERLITLLARVETTLADPPAPEDSQP